MVRGSWAVNIRKFLTQHRTLESLVAQGSVPPHLADLLHRALLEGRSVIVSGATHAGKTTLLGALLASVADRQRIVTVEETFELAVDGLDVVALNTGVPGYAIDVYDQSSGSRTSFTTRRDTPKGVLHRNRISVTPSYRAPCGWMNIRSTKSA